MVCICLEFLWGWSVNCKRTSSLDLTGDSWHDKCTNRYNNLYPLIKWLVSFFQKLLLFLPLARKRTFDSQEPGYSWNSPAISPASCGPRSIRDVYVFLHPLLKRTRTHLPRNGQRPSYARICLDAVSVPSAKDWKVAELTKSYQILVKFVTWRHIKVMVMMDIKFAKEKCISNC